MKKVREITIHHDIVIYERTDELADEVVYDVYDNGKQVYGAYDLKGACGYVDYYYGTSLWKGENNDTK
jgi:hypothetical protein